MQLRIRLVVAFVAALTGSFALAQSPSLPPNALPGLNSPFALLPGESYRPDIPTQESILGFESGTRAVSSEDVSRCLSRWAEAARDRTLLVEYARSWEDRPLHYLVITAPENLNRLDELRADLSRLADPRDLGQSQADDLIETLKPVAWLAYTIHGDETEGSDAALALIYHLLAAQDAETESLLHDLIIIIDPLMNPDGRARFIKMIQEHRGTMPNVDDRSLLHTGYWPRGRGNHYLFDLNRDWIYGTQVETQGRIREVGRWNPQLFVDAHGMGPQDTHLFSPSRDPINPNIPQARETWGVRFAQNQARALDQHQWTYYTGEWAEEWYPGYSDGWASYRGAIGILYEQARIAEDGVRRPEGRILSYRESVRHHLVGSLSNLQTLHHHARELLRSFYQTRCEAVDPEGRYANRTFAILPSPNRSRFNDLHQLLLLEGFETYVAEEDLTVPLAQNQLGEEQTDQLLPQGTLLIPNRQPLAHLLAAMLEFDPRLTPETLQKERQELLRKGKSRIYDTTAWNLTMMFGLEAYTLPSQLPGGVARARTPHRNEPTIHASAKEPVTYVIDGADDRSVAAAARLMELGLEVRLADKAFEFDGKSFARGSVLVNRVDNSPRQQRLAPTLAATLRQLDLSAHAVGSGMGPGDLPDLGGQHFHRLAPPRIAVLARENVSPSDYGAVWFVLDHRLGIRHSHLDSENPMDLDRYNVLVVPDATVAAMPDRFMGQVKEWVRQGGTLIVIAGATQAFTKAEAELSQVRQLPTVLKDLADYELTILREWMGANGSSPEPSLVWSHRPSNTLDYPWTGLKTKKLEETELKRRDTWQKLFMPQGAFLATRVDPEHWLTVGCPDPLPVLAMDGPVLMSKTGVDTPLRYGFLTHKSNGENCASKSTEDAPDPAESEPTEEDEDEQGEDQTEDRRLGWSALPEQTEMTLRLSGLLWPEAAHRLANTAYLTRESVERGQVILFASPPAFRGAARGTTRLLMNAVVYGPGLGTRPTIRP